MLGMISNAAAMKSCATACWVLGVPIGCWVGLSLCPLNFTIAPAINPTPATENKRKMSCSMSDWVVSGKLLNNELKLLRGALPELPR